MKAVKMSDLSPDLMELSLLGEHSVIQVITITCVQV